MKKSVETTLNKKLRLERELIISLRPIFVQMAASSMDITFSARSYNIQISDVIFKHDIRVSDLFIGDYRRKHLVAMDPLQETMMILDMRKRIDSRAFEQSVFIGNTNARQHKQVGETITRRTKKILAENPNISLDDINLKRSIYMGFLLSRLPIIACTETQWSAEHAKFIETAYLTGSKGVSTKALPKKFKRWDAMGDDRMRDAHAMADSQVQAFADPFLVGGEKLLFPGDRSLGATLGNIINCRCSTGFAIDKKALTGALFRDAVTGVVLGTPKKVLVTVVHKTQKQVIAEKIKRDAQRAAKKAKAKIAKTLKDRKIQAAVAKIAKKKATKKAKKAHAKSTNLATKAKNAKKAEKSSKVAAKKAAEDC